VNLALAAALSNAAVDGPLAALLRAADLLAHGGGSSSGVVAEGDGDLDAALIAAEGVDPWAVSMQLSQRVINSLWEALMGSTVSTPGSSSSGASISTPEGAAAAWQAIVTDLLAGTKSDVALQLLFGFVNTQEGWEAGLRALAVAAALQRKSGSTALLQPLSARVCKRNRHPALAFLVLLLQQQAVQLAPGDTAVVLGEALQQLLAYYGTLAADLADISAPDTAASSSSSSEGSAAGWLGLQGAGSGGEFDAWGFDALFRDLDVFGNSESAGPRYRSSSPFAAGSDTSRAGETAKQQQQQQCEAVAKVVVDQVESLLKAAVARGHAVEAGDFVMQLLGVTVCSEGQLPAAAVVGGKAATDSSDARGNQLVLVVSEKQQGQLLTLAADCCTAALASCGSSGSDEAAAAAAVMPAVLPAVLAALAASGQVSSCIDLAAAVCGSYCRSRMAHLTIGRHNGIMSSSTADNSSAAAHFVTAELVGEAITAAAAAVATVEGSVSAAKPWGSALLAGASRALFAADLPVEQCLVLLAAVAAYVEERLALQLVAASAGKLHSVMPQAVAVARSSRHE
jgi:hypothetical protein